MQELLKKLLIGGNIFLNFQKNIFNKITLALPQNTETQRYLKILGTKNINYIGNLKYFGENKKKSIDWSLKIKFIKKIFWCAASTHYNEELSIGKIHKDLRSNIKNLITIIIPRHINRKNEIINELNDIGLKTQLHSSYKKIEKNTDIYLVDTYGEASKFYKLSKLTFLGGSLIPHGGQNPLEPAREGNYILYGPNINNFKEVYRMLENLRIATKIRNIKKMKSIILKKINYKQENKISKKLNYIGIEILNKNFSEIKKYI